MYRKQAFQLVTPMRWELGVRMERKPVDTGTAGAPHAGVFSCWEQTDAAPLPPLRVVPASGLPAAATRAARHQNGVCNASPFHISYG